MTKPLSYLKNNILLSVQVYMSANSICTHLLQVKKYIPTVDIFNAEEINSSASLSAYVTLVVSGHARLFLSFGDHSARQSCVTFWILQDCPCTFQTFPRLLQQHPGPLSHYSTALLEYWNTAILDEMVRRYGVDEYTGFQSGPELLRLVILDVRPRIIVSVD